jgi:hypothetical protein
MLSACLIGNQRRVASGVRAELDEFSLTVWFTGGRMPEASTTGYDLEALQTSLAGLQDIQGCEDGDDYDRAAAHSATAAGHQ